MYDVATLFKVGAIAKKLGITWGDTWTNNIDRLHFEIRASWSPLKGYKLEGEIIVPTTSSMKVQLIVEDKKGEVKMSNWNPRSSAIKQSTEEYIEQAVKDKIIQESHLKDLKNGIMTTDLLVGLFITIVQRRK